MRILITNDDGVHSEGLWALAESLREVGEVCVVAPDRDQSGVGTAMTLMTVVRATEIVPPVKGVKSYSVQGTPADCVILATGALFSEPFDLLFSGINLGANLGMDVVVSGTVGGALQGFLRGIPSVAISAFYSDKSEVRYEVAAQVAKTLASGMGRNALPSIPLLNVNLPDVALSGMDGVEVTRFGGGAFLQSVERDVVGRRPYYWIRHNRPTDYEPKVGTDLWAIENNRVSITPIGPILSNGDITESVQALADIVRSGLMLG